ncbi:MULTISPECIES: LysM peptidoglycan-binding domain-containing protein [Vibrio]|uniref:LysM peptidoglycan-binding domain-containing protein n=2 Tax=Vibrio TaxID=662 RepID=A0A7X4LGT5_9VIBR|nr:MULTISPECIES: LysM peptidoglycan-binding domain-containing protein [Vibrio]MBF8999401.1 LysM peptidoglycan-binding domain-containing protein [Vibrio nitrifigilis]MZI91649.1 LysM peptidoglycan-binding domain-containing protein [Vibrio eleionomae]
MRVHFSWVLALLLAGCQITQPENQTTPETNGDSSSQSDSVTESSAVQAEHDTAAIHKPKVATPQEQSDLWKRIGMQLKIGIPNNRSVAYYRTWYLKHPKHLEIVAQRAKPFLYLITQKIEDRGLPLELALLPIVESAFDAFAYSHGSAAGLWQFVPSTGKMYGLEQNFWYDGRRDVDAATDAALDYLSVLGKRFDGDWYQAIAAYNSGGGTISRAIRKNERLNKPTDFFSLDLPKETTGYVPKLLALADIVAHQKKYGIDLPEIPNEPVLQLVDPDEQLDLAIAAKYAGMSVKELQSYNPAYNQWATAPNGPHQLLIPVGKVTTFDKNLAENQGDGMKLIRYKVQSGDTLSVIAAKHKTTTKVIETANSLSSNVIRVGQYLMIPTSVKDPKAYALTASNRLKRLQSLARGQYKIDHVVQSGESLWTIARQNNVSYRSLAKWNGMSPLDTLRLGQKLVIWKTSSDGAIIRTVFYHVRSGDSLSTIAQRFKVKTNDIIQWNDLANEKYLQPGQKLKLYVDVTKVSV